MIKLSSRMRWSGHVAYMEQMKIVYKVKTSFKKQGGGGRRMWAGYTCLDKDQWQAVINMKMDLKDTIESWEFFD
jgi:hypothetical protein